VILALSKPADALTFTPRTGTMSASTSAPVLVAAPAFWYVW
jgi:hypothetical protein